MRIHIPTLFLLLLPFLNGCGGGERVKIDGSSTVYPITEAIAEEHRKKSSSTSRITVGFSGTGGGFKKFARGQTAINDASRRISEGEKELAEKNGVEYIELEVAYDGMAVVVNPENDWLDTISVEQLRKIWEPDAQGEVMKWSDVEKDWPDQKLYLYGPGVQSGTYDYFTNVIVGEEGASRGDYTSSEDDNNLVQGVKSEKYSLGFFGFAYYEENKEALKLIAVDNGDEAVLPSSETISSKRYQPLTRPLFIYVRKDAAQREAIREFVEFYLEKAGDIVEEVGYFPLREKEYKAQLEKFREFAGKAEGS